VLVVFSVVAYFCVGLFTLAFGRRFPSHVNGDARGSTGTSFTVFLPTFNESSNIEEKLANVFQQTAFDEMPGELLIYDCSTDNTREIVRAYSSKFAKIRLIEETERRGVPAAFNSAIREAKGDVIIKTDCDSLANSSYDISRLIQTILSDERIGGVSGICINKEREGGFRNLVTRLQIAETNLDSTIVAHSSSLVAFKKGIAQPVDPQSMAEDTEEFVRIRRLGFKTVVNPTVISTERIPSTIVNRLKQKKRRASGIMRVLVQNIDLLFNRRFGLYGTVIFPLNFFLLIVSPLLLLSDAIVLWVYAFSLGIVPLILATTLLVGVLLVYVTNRPVSFAAALDIQIFALLGLIDMVRSPATPTWKVHRN